MLVSGCDRAGEGAELPNEQGFTKLNGSRTNVTFRNDLRHDDAFNIYTYRNFYNGGGVAIGDVNGDTLPDIFLTANMAPNRLYLNRGDFRFEDVTDSAGVGGTHGWSTGVTMIDVDADGLLDVYVCNSGRLEDDDKRNELYINQGGGRFRESAADYGLDDPGLSTHAAFFDYDRDGDLDVYLLNNSFQPIGSFNLRKNLRPVRDSIGGDKLLRNELVETGTTHFTDVSEEAGIYGSVIGFGLGVTVGDINLDGWPDMYVSNDFFERDYLYVNRGDGTFDEVLTDAIKATSNASMGADMADLTGDGYPEIFVTDMLPASDKRLKMNTTFESWDNYVNKLQNGYYHQFTRNTLQQNNGDGTFSEVGRARGVEATDWSWGALMLDLDTDGDRDVFVANGIYQDLTNQDYITFISSNEGKAAVTASGKVDFGMLVDLIPSEPVANVAFVNDGDGRMREVAAAFGLADTGFSNGAAYGDLDNDGDLDLVVNNVNSEAWIYRNDQPRDSLHASLVVSLEGEGHNAYGVGARVSGWCGDREFVAEQIPTHGFQSSVDPRVFLGLGTYAQLDSLRVDWPSGARSHLTDVRPGSLTIAEAAAQPGAPKAAFPFGKIGQGKQEFAERDVTELGVDFVHQENEYVDFDRQRLLYSMLSTPGPCTAVGDVDGDGREDIFIGGASDQAGALYLQSKGGRFRKTAHAVFDGDSSSEDTDAVIFDADGDGDEDLLVGSGGSEFSDANSAIKDRLYLNDGRGRFEPAPRSVWPSSFSLTSCFAVGDYDADGDEDVFVGSRMRPQVYGVPTDALLLRNDGGRFVRVRGAAFDTLGLVTDASWVDLDADGDLDLAVAREWGSVAVFANDAGSFSKLSERDSTSFGASPSGWWSAIRAEDVDGDGDTDLLLGNHGLNSRFRASAEQPVTMVVSDFDGNGTVEQIISRYLGDTSLPIVLRHDLVMQMPSLKKKYLAYDSYYGQSIEQIFDRGELENALRLRATELRSGCLLNENGRFRFVPFPFEAQLSNVFAIAALPPGSNQRKRYLLGGNLYGVKPEVGRYDASGGVVVTWNGSGFDAERAPRIGLPLEGEIRSLKPLRVAGVPSVLVGRNNAAPQLFSLSDEDAG